MRRNLTVIEHDTEICDVDHVLVELVPSQKSGESLFILNVYSSPREKTKFRSLFRKTINITKNQALVIVGDFNASHAAWGYDKENIKGRNLSIDAQQEGLTLVTDPLFPTRIGNSISKDTSPDLTFTKNIIETYWLNTHENMGSDHYIIETTFKAGPRKREGRALKMVEWDSFRKIREREASDAIEDLDEWLGKLKQNIQMATKTISKTEGLENTDSKLLHMWEAKKSLEKRWKKQKHNKSLRKKDCHPQ